MIILDEFLVCGCHLWLSRLWDDFGRQETVSQSNDMVDEKPLVVEDLTCALSGPGMFAWQRLPNLMWSWWLVSCCDLVAGAAIQSFC